MLTRYVKPQDFGNRAGTRWVQVHDGTGSGLCIDATDTPVHFSLHPYSLANLTAATHQAELTRDDRLHLYIDHAVRGLGTASCGPGPLEKYVVPIEPFAFELTLRGVG
jgi:hypothetical protein